MVSHAAMRLPLTANPGDRIADKPQTTEEKARQVAVDTHDFTGEHITVPTYFVVNYPNGQTEALHHVKDAKKISDVIRQMRFDEEDKKLESVEVKHWLNWTGLTFIIGFFLLTALILVGIF